MNMDKKSYLKEINKGLSYYSYRKRLMEELSDHIDDAGEGSIEELGNVNDMKKAINDLSGGSFTWVFVAIFATALLVPILSVPLFAEMLTTQMDDGSFQINIMPVVIVDLLLVLGVLPGIAGKYLHTQKSLAKGFIAQRMFVVVAIARLAALGFILIVADGLSGYGGSMTELAGIILLSVVANAGIAAMVSYKAADSKILSFIAR